MSQKRRCPMPHNDGKNTAKNDKTQQSQKIQQFLAKIKRSHIKPMSEYQPIYQELKKRLMEKHNAKTFEELPEHRQVQFALSDMTNQFEMKLKDYERYFNLIENDYNEKLPNKKNIGLRRSEYKKAMEKIIVLYPMLESQTKKILTEWEEAENKYEAVRLKINKLQSDFVIQKEYLRKALEHKSPESVLEQIKHGYRQLENAIGIAQKEARLLKEKLFDLSYLNLTNYVKSEGQSRDIDEKLTKELLYTKFYSPMVNQLNRRLKTLKQKNIIDLPPMLLEKLEKVAVPEDFIANSQEDYLNYMVVKIIFNNRIRKEFEIEKIESFLGACSYNQEILILKDEYNGNEIKALGDRVINKLANFVTGYETGSLAYRGFVNVLAGVPLDEKVSEEHKLQPVNRQRCRETFLRFCCTHPEIVKNLSLRFPQITLDKIKADIITYKDEIKKKDPKFRKPIDDKVYEAAALQRSGQKPVKKTKYPLINKYNRDGRRLKGMRKWLIPEKDTRTQTEIKADEDVILHSRSLSHIPRQHLNVEIRQFNRADLLREGLTYNPNLDSVSMYAVQAFSTKKQKKMWDAVDAGTSFEKFIEVMEMKEADKPQLFSIFAEGCKPKLSEKQVKAKRKPGPEKVPVSELWCSYHKKQEVIKQINSLEKDASSVIDIVKFGLKPPKK